MGGMGMSVCRLPILLLFCILPLLISALGEEINHEVEASSVELQAAIVKREKGNRRNSKNRQKGKKKTRTGKKRPKSGKNNEKESKTRRRQRQKTRAKGGEGRQISGNATSCAMKAIKYARLFEGKATSIFRQVKRVKGNDKVQGSKGKKKGDFNATMDRLVAALGGDIDNPKCDGQAIPSGPASGNATFRNGTTAKSTIDSLKNCEKDIEEKCSKALTGNATK